jgi:hypothetical protein
LQAEYVNPLGGSLDTQVRREIYLGPEPVVTRKVDAIFGALRLSGNITGTGDPVLEDKLAQGTTEFRGRLMVDQTFVEGSPDVADNILLAFNLGRLSVPVPTEGRFAPLPVGSNMMRSPGDY